MKPSEKVALGLALEELEKPKARERKTGRPPISPDPGAHTLDGDAGRVREVVGPAVGLSGKNYDRAKRVVQAKGVREAGRIAGAYCSASTAAASSASVTPSAWMIRRTLSQLGAVRATSMRPKVPTDRPALKASVSCVTFRSSRSRLSTAARA